MIRNIILVSKKDTSSRLILKGPKISLKDWEKTDFAYYKRAVKSSVEWLRCEAPWTVSSFNYQTDFNAIKHEIDHNLKSKVRNNLIIYKNDTDPIGFVNRYWRSKETNWLRIGIRILDKNDWGKGYGFEAITIWVDYLFTELNNLKNIGMTTWSGNEALIRLAYSLGMIIEARHRKVRSFSGLEYDAIGFAVLREEWTRKTEYKTLNFKGGQNERQKQ